MALNLYYQPHRSALFRRRLSQGTENLGSGGPYAGYGKTLGHVQSISWHYGDSGGTDKDTPYQDPLARPQVRLGGKPAGYRPSVWNWAS
jgi:hypothetical protein